MFRAALALGGTVAYMGTPTASTADGNPGEPDEAFCIAELELVVAGLQAEAATCVASGVGRYVVQLFADWADRPRWVDHVSYDDHGETSLAFATREAAQRYIEVRIELDYARAHAGWAMRYAAWEPQHEKYLLRRSLLVEHGLWADEHDAVQPLVVPAGPGREPVRDHRKWRVVDFEDSDSYDPAVAASPIHWCGSCRGRVGIDVDCADVDHEHRGVPYHRRSAPASASWRARAAGSPLAQEPTEKCGSRGG
jgi:hypothetical protein